MIAQTVLTIDDSPTGTAALIFFQTLGGAVMVSEFPEPSKPCISVMLTLVYR
jgi:hypothetical protein